MYRYGVIWISARHFSSSDKIGVKDESIALDISKGSVLPSESAQVSVSLKPSESSVSSVVDNITTNKVVDRDTVFSNPMDVKMRGSFAALNDEHSKNASRNYNSFSRSMISFFTDRVIRFNPFSSNVYDALFTRMNKAYGFLTALIEVRVDSWNGKLLAFFRRYFSSMRINNVQFVKSLFFTDHNLKWNKFMSSLSVRCQNKRVVLIYTYNLLYNFIVSLFSTVDPAAIKVTVVGTRFAKDNLNANGIKTTVYSVDGSVKSSFSPYIHIKNRNLRMRDVMTYIPFAKHVVNTIIGSVFFRCLSIKFVRYDVEAGSVIINTPSSPSADNTAFVTRNMNTRMSENIAIYVESINSAVLLLVFRHFHKTILSNDVLCNLFWSHFINSMISDDTLNFFNCNFEMAFEFSVGKVKFAATDILPITVANLNNSSCAFNDDEMCEAFLLNVLSGTDMDNDSMFVSVSEVDYNIFSDLHSDAWSFTIVANERFDDNINRVDINDFILMSIIKRYFGKFYPAIVNSISFVDSFIPTDNGTTTGELYQTDISWRDFIKATIPSFAVSDVFIFRELVNADSFPNIFNVVEVIDSTPKSTVQ